MHKRAIIYARVSTTRQAEHDLSIPDQIAHGERYCNERGLSVVARYIDPGSSARDDNRPEFQRMIADIKAGAIVADVLLVHSFSRFFRDSYGSAFYSRELAKHGVRVVSATQEVGEDSSGVLIRNVLSAFDEYASLETAKHVQRSMLENARRGFWNGSTPPFGYRTIVTERHGAKDKKKLAIEPAEAEIVKLAFQLYLFGDGDQGPMGIKAVTSALNARGLTQRGGRPFRVQTVHAMLTRSTYTGCHYFNRSNSRTRRQKPREQWVAVQTPLIVADDVFHAVQAQLNARSPLNTPPRLTNSEVLLSGVARCGQCGGPMRSRTGKSGRYWYYTCARKSDIGATACSGSTISMDILDQVVTDAVCDQVLDPVRLSAMIQILAARNAGRSDALRAELRGLMAKHRELSAQVRNLLDVIEKGGLAGASSLQERFAARQLELDQLDQLLAYKRREFDQPPADVAPGKVQAFANALRCRLRDDESGAAFRRAYMRLTLDKVVVERDAIRISGPKAALAQQLAADNPLPPSLVPTSVQEWRTRQDSNL